MTDCTYQMEDAKVDEEQGGWIEPRFCSRTHVAVVTDPLSGQQWFLCARHFGTPVQRYIAERKLLTETIVRAN